MALTESKRKANKKYLDKNYEHINLSYPKGTKEIWKAAAAARGLSLAEFVRRSVEDAILKK